MAQLMEVDTAASAPVQSGSFSSSLDDQIERLKKCEHLTESEVKNLCQKAREILVDESNVQRVDAPVTVSALTQPQLSRGALIFFNFNKNIPIYI
jgi:hypothetical protein